MAKGTLIGFLNTSCPLNGTCINYQMMAINECKLVEESIRLIEIYLS